jgi:hypothetical protein
MKNFLKNVLYIVIFGIVAGIVVEKYAISEHERIKSKEKEVQKQKINKENEILIKRLEEDYQAYKDSIDQVFIMKKKEIVEKQGEPPAGAELAIKMRFDAEKSRILAKKRKEIDRQIEDLKLRLDF